MKTLLCPICSSFLDQHPEYKWRELYKKCGSCGYAKKVEPFMEVISLKDYFMGRDVSYKDEYSPELEKNARTLLLVVNQLLTDLNITKATVSSGWRPPSLNKTIGNAAKKSLHMNCLAVDILDDKDQTLGKLVASRPDLLKKYNLFLEALDSTKGKNTNWVHLDIGIRTDRPSRIFHP